MSATTAADLLVLHAVRTLGYADAARIAHRARLPEAEAAEHLLDAQASGWIALTSHAGDSGWSMTETGKQEGERLLAAELDAADAREAVEHVHADFLPLNAIVSKACTDWQLHELGITPQPMGPDETIAPVDLGDIIATLDQVASELQRLEERLTRHLARFAGYYHRFSGAVARARIDPRWITATDRDSGHRVWFELHEDLIATLGLTR